MPKKIASLSLDLDNKWSYMKTHGDDGWESFPSYLDIAVPRILDFCKQRDLDITVFVVGQDAALEKNHDALRSIADAGHEIGNHSFNHEPWLHLYSEKQLEEEFDLAEQHIFNATGKKTVGFRGPGFSLSEKTLRVLSRRGYEYEASTFPTFLGPLARTYYFMTADLTKTEREEREQLFGKFREGFRPLKPYAWKMPGREANPLIEIPVTTMPVFKLPIHVSYILYLGQFSPFVARMYFRISMLFCKAFDVAPSLLLHPLDFLGCDDDSDLSFFPVMGVPAERKIKLVGDVIDMMSNSFEVGTMLQHTRHIRATAAQPMPLVPYVVY